MTITSQSGGPLDGRGTFCRCLKSLQRALLRPSQPNPLPDDALPRNGDLAAISRCRVYGAARRCDGLVAYCLLVLRRAFR